MNLYEELLEKYNVISIKPVTKGLSGDKKLRIDTACSGSLLLRISETEAYTRIKSEYDMLTRAAAISNNVPRPLGFGLCNNGKGIYQLMSWCDGEDAENLLPSMDTQQQYAVGEKAGQLLKQLHSIPAPENQEPWGLRFRRKIQGRVDYYNSAPISSKGGDILVKYLQNNQALLDNRPQTFNHGDYNISNLIISPSGGLSAIDFNYYNLGYGDPWWEFDAYIWGQEPSGYFSMGQINGYFANNPPAYFFEMLAYYMAYGALAALTLTDQGEEGTPEEGKTHMENVLKWFDNMSSTIPSWYLGGQYEHH